jgi:thiol:disulfide interchange protein DsbC
MAADVILSRCSLLQPKTSSMKLVAFLLATASLTFGLSVHAQDANLKKTLTERIPQLEKIDEVRSTP